MTRPISIFCKTLNNGLSRAVTVACAFLLLFALTGCMSSSSGSDDTGQTDTSSSAGGTDSGGDGGTGTGGGDTSNSGGSTGGSGDSGTGGSGTGGSGTGDSGSGDTGTIYGTFASVYTDNTGNLDLLNCINPASQNFNVSSVTFRLFEQTGNNVEAAITIVPQNQEQFNQAFLRVTGSFTPEDGFVGSATIVYSLDTVILEDESVTDIKILLVGETIFVTFSLNTELTDCGLDGELVLSEPVDSGNTGGDTGGTGGDTGGGTGTGDTGGDTGGGTGTGDTGGTGGGDTGGGTGTGGSTGGDIGTWIEATGQFGSLQMLSAEFRNDNGTFEMTTAALMVVPGLEGYVWTNVEEATVSVFFESGNSHTLFNSTNGRQYHCECFPNVDLLNNQVIFNNLEVFKPTSPTGSLTINGTLSIVQ